MLMIKPSKKTLDKQNNVTIFFGYSLFIATVVTVIIGTIIPLGSALFHPTARHFNIVVLLFTFTAAAVLPALVSYVLGDRATHTKNKLLHHYNGVLFGIAAYWVALLVTFIGISQYILLSGLPAPILGTVIVNGLPIIITIAVMAYVAISYAHKRNNKASILHHRPYQVVLIGSTLGFLGYVIAGQNYGVVEILWLSISSTLIPIILTVVSYRVLAKYHTSRVARFADAVIAMSIASIVSSLANTFVAYLTLPFMATIGISYAIAIAIWALYLYLRSRKA